MSSQILASVMKDKLNPEFIGVAHKLSSFKHKRKLIEQKRNSILRSLKFKMSLDIGLSKSLEERTSKLQEVQQVYQRRTADQELKMQQKEKRKKQLRNLSNSVKQRRNDLKQNIKESLFQVFTRNRNLREQGRQLSQIIQSRVKQNDEQALLNNRFKYKMVKSMEKQGQNKVNHYYRSMNKESLSAYKNWITEQRQKIQQYYVQIQKMESAILKVDMQIEKKKNKIMNLFSDIETYTYEPLSNQSKCLPSCLRSNLSLSSHSSKPKDLLLKGTKELFERC